MFPSKSANSIQVMNQCKAFSQLGHDVALIGVRSDNASDKEISEYYDFESSAIQLKLTSNFKRFQNLLISIFGAFFYLTNFKNFDFVFSRNLYFSFFMTFLPVKHTYEEHMLYRGWRKRMQSRIFRSSKRVRHIFISEALKNFVEQSFCVQLHSALVLHDCGNPDYSKISPNEDLSEAGKFSLGYVGHLYSGRGIEVIVDVAKSRNEWDVFVVGGLESDVTYWKSKTEGINNIHFLGHSKPSEALKFMKSVDALLMPYQYDTQVAGKSGISTSTWMSPLKMFEYMSVNKPIVSSDLPVLREVLEDQVSALMVDPEKPTAWVDALDRLEQNESLRNALASSAFGLIENKYNWKQRCTEVLSQK